MKGLHKCNQSESEMFIEVFVEQWQIQKFY